MVDPISVRKEIRELEPEEVYLYLEGLARFQQQGWGNPLSYNQIAGTWAEFQLLMTPS